MTVFVGAAAVAAQPDQPAAPAAGVRFRRATAADVLAIRLQPSQAIGGMEVSAAMAEVLAAGDAWAAERGGELLAVAGVHRPFAGWHGVAWAFLAEGIGAAHLAITRFARARIAEHPAERVEAVVRMNVPAEPRWAELVGLWRVAYLPGWGPDDGAFRACYARIRGWAAGRQPTMPTLPAGGGGER